MNSNTTHNLPLVKVIYINNSIYIYDTNKNSVIKPDDSDVEIVLRYCKIGKEAFLNTSTQDERIIIEKYLADGFLLCSRPQIIEHPQANLYKSFLCGNISQIILQVTKNCNFNCKYCTFSDGVYNTHHSNEAMTFDIAKKAIDFYHDMSVWASNAHISFYGGEPFLNWALIEKCLEYSTQIFEGKKLSFSMTSNLYLLNQHIMGILNKYKIDLLISLDGPKQINDKNRILRANGRGTFSIVYKNLEMLLERFPNYAKNIRINAVVDPEVDEQCIVDFFSHDNLFNNISVERSYLDDDNLSTVFYNSPESIEYQKKLELMRIVNKSFHEENKIKCDYGTLSEIDSIETLLSCKSCIDKKYHPNGPCIPGYNRLFVDVNGDFFPCEKVNLQSNNICIGNTNDGLYYDKVYKFMNIGKMSESKCVSCWAMRLCSICPAEIDTGTEYSLALKNEKCKKSKATAVDMIKKYILMKELEQ